MVTRSVPRQGKTAFAPEWIAKREARIYKQAHPKQLGFVTDPASRITCLVGRGGGKTTGGLLRFLLKMIRKPRMRCVFLAATRESAEELIWEQLKESLANLDVPYTPHQVKLKVTLGNGSTLILRGCDSKDDINKLRGRHFDEVGIDETAIVPSNLLDDILDRVIGPRLVGALWMISTPGHILNGEFYNATRMGAVDADGVPLHRPYDERHQPAYAGWDRWSSHAWTLLDGVAAGVPAMIIGWTKALETKRRKGWSDTNPIWMREYLGLWAADDTETVFRYRAFDANGKPWNQWDPERPGAARIAVLPDGFDDWQFAIGLDLGHHDPTAITTWAWSPSDKECLIYQVGEHVATEMYARTIVEVLLGPERSHDRPAGIIGALREWPSGMVADTAGLGDAMLAEILNVYGVNITAAQKGYKYKFPMIENCNGSLLDGKVKILKGSQLEKEMLTLQWHTDQHGTLSENKSQSNHCTDSFIYAREIIAKLFEANGGVLDKPAPKKRGPVEAPPLPEERSEHDESHNLTSATFEADDWG